MKKYLKIWTIAISSLTLLTISSCENIKPIESEQLEGHWTLTTMNGEHTNVFFEGTIPSVTFNFEDSIIAGNAGCNSYNGYFSLNEKNEFSAPTLAATLMMCMHKHAEEDFLKNLSEQKLVLSISSEGLLSFVKEGTPVLIFEKGVAPEVKLSAEPTTTTDENI